MQGSVRKRGTTWSYRIDFGKLDGKRKQIEKGGYKTKKEADKALADALYQINNFGEFVENQKITFSEVYDEFIATEAQATRAYATIKRYNSLYRNHYKEIFGGLFVYQISANMVNDFLNEKRLKYSEEYVKGLYKTLKVQISWSEAEKHIDRLIKSRNYLNEADIKNIPNYEKEELILKIRQAYMYDTDENTIMPYPSDADYYKTKDILMQKLNNKVQTQTMLTDLKNLLAETTADLRSYPLRQAAVQDLEKYANGEYNLFPHIDRIEDVKEKTIPERLTEMSDEEKQELVDSVEMKLDYGENYDITENEIELYNAITNEQPQQPFSEYLAELHKDDNGSKTIALIPLGDFYESYGEDAENAAQVLDIALSSKQIEDNAYKMCGFPKHTLDEYANKLLYAGYDVVIADENRKYNRLLSADKIIMENEKRLHCCFTGHRPEKLSISETEARPLLEKAIDTAIGNGFTTFITGMAQGIDIWAAEIVLQKRNHNAALHLICAVPHPGFEK